MPNDWIDWTARAQEHAATKVRDILSRTMPETRDMLGLGDVFDPWDIFPAVYGTYCSSFDQCAIDVLSEIVNGKRVREDLGADMLREMLCTADLCSYGTSPRVCFPSTQFKELLPELIEKWITYEKISWGED